jgi:protein-disulfide isomerase
MLKHLRPYTIGPTSILLAGVLLAACGGAATPAAQEAVTPVTGAVTSVGTSEATQEVAATTATTTTESEATIAVPTANVAVAGPAQPAVCQAVQIPSNDRIAPVSDKDWTKGPANAPVTLIEYGDFQ